MNLIKAKPVVMVAVLAAGLSIGAPAYSDEPQHLGEQISEKFVRGMVNLSTGWVEVPRQIYEVGINEGWMQGVLRGPFDGIGMFFARTVAGAIEAATFPVPLPSYEPMLMPIYPWQSVGPSDTMTADSQ